MRYECTVQQPKSSAARVAAELDRLGLPTRIVTLPDSTRSAPDAARAIGCGLGQIVKSLVFRRVDDDAAVLVLMAGDRRVDEARLAAVVGAPVEQATGRFVRDATGYAIGGVPPVGHREGIATFVDAALLAHPEVWAAAGTPHSVFPIAPDDLVRAAAGRVVEVAAP